MRLGQLLAVVIFAGISSGAIGHSKAPSNEAETIKLHPLVALGFPETTASTLGCDTTVNFACLPAASAELQASVSAKAFLVLDRKSGVVVASHNAGNPLYPASTAKLMTAILVHQNLDLQKTITVEAKDRILGGSTVFSTGDQLSVQDALAALLISSDNGIAFALARAISGDVGTFVSQMNQNAIKLHLINSNFSNPAGLDDVNQQMTAWDISVLGRRVVAVPELSELVAAEKWTPTSIKLTQPLKNTNILLSHPELHSLGIKTGTTPLAGEVLVSLFESGNREWLIVVLGSRNRFGDTLTLLHWAQTAIKDTTIVDFAADFSQDSHVE